MRSNKLESILL